MGKKGQKKVVKKGKKKKKNKKTSEKWKQYKLEGNKVSRLKKPCPRCGPGIFLSNHKDRLFCGKCHYTEYIKK
ncbi:MAG: 30S ribosomal protein S27ae [archaeon]|nr:MAG: 30S ribosomal protein S27ae [archaeon]